MKIMASLSQPKGHRSISLRSQSRPWLIGLAGVVALLFLFWVEPIQLSFNGAADITSSRTNSWYTQPSFNNAANATSASVSSTTTTTMWIPKTTARSCATKSIDTLEPFLKSQSKEDEELLRRFNGVCGGTYIEMGALDGVLFSNSFVFNSQFGWRGVLIELTPENYARLVQKRKNEIVRVNAAVCNKQQDLHLVKGFGAVSGVWEFTSEEYHRQWWPDIHSTKGLPTIQCLPLADLLDKHVPANAPLVTRLPEDPRPHYFFDFLSLDVEGAEWSVLESIDWTRTAFGILFLEKPNAKGMQEDVIMAFMARQGYIFRGQVETNYWFIHKHYDEIYAPIV